jgi:hypothetical protein
MAKFNLKNILDNEELDQVAIASKSGAPYHAIRCTNRYTPTPCVAIDSTNIKYFSQY